MKNIRKLFRKYCVLLVLPSSNSWKYWSQGKAPIWTCDDECILIDIACYRKKICICNTDQIATNFDKFEGHCAQEYLVSDLQFRNSSRGLEQKVTGNNFSKDQCNWAFSAILRVLL